MADPIVFTDVKKIKLLFSDKFTENFHGSQRVNK